MLTSHFSLFLKLIRWHQPIGNFLLLWPTLSAIWLASLGHPHAKTLLVFMSGVFLLRALGCIINDYADRHWDGKVPRTAQRPLASGEMSPSLALVYAAILLMIAFFLVLWLNLYTIILAIMGVILAFIYPFLKRLTDLPQLGLGLAFNWGILMAFSAEQNHISLIAILFFLAALCITVAYDTMYAMTDKAYDLKVGIKSSAILFADKAPLMIVLLQVSALILLLAVGRLARLNVYYYFGIMMWLICMLYQQGLIKDGEPSRCFRAFFNNHLAWLMIYLGIVLALAA